VLFGLDRRLRARRAARECTHAVCPTCGRPLSHDGLDWLTGLLNRGAWDHHAGRLLAEGAGPVALLMADLDKLKWINDVHGHLAGDEALRRFATVLRSVTRGHDLLARYGGDEFLALLPGADADAALDVAQRLNTELSGARLDTVSARDGQVALTGLSASVGVAAQSTDDQDTEGHSGLEPLLLAADAALLAAKRGGRGRSCLSGTFQLGR
jgi:diguanylate cyclase (GGDEF)-like protein